MKITDPPKHGIHHWLMTAARQCRNKKYSQKQCLKILNGYEPRLRRPYQLNEVENAVSKVYGTELAGAKKAPKPQPWHPEATAMAERNYAATIDDLLNESPVCIDELSQRECLESLFPDPDGLVCIGQSVWIFKTARLPEFEDLESASFIVPGYMITEYGTKLDGKRSMHSLNNTGPRRFCVDEPPSREHSSILLHLKRFWPLAMIVGSGGKSLHGWFNVTKDDEPEFWKQALWFGADRALMRNRSSFVRLPMGKRDNGSPQNVYYFNPSNIPT